MAILVEDVGSELSLESPLKHARIDQFLPNEEFHVGTITCVVPAKLREHQIMNLEGTKPKALEASWSKVHEP